MVVGQKDKYFAKHQQQSRCKFTAFLVLSRYETQYENEQPKQVEVEICNNIPRQKCTDEPVGEECKNVPIEVSKFPYIELIHLNNCIS